MGNIYGTWTDAVRILSYVTTDPLSGGSSYALGYTAVGGTNGLQYIRPYYDTNTLCNRVLCFLQGQTVKHLQHLEPTLHTEVLVVD